MPTPSTDDGRSLDRLPVRGPAAVVLTITTCTSQLRYRIALEAEALPTALRLSLQAAKEALVQLRKGSPG
jgi:hypothetical protein